MEDRIVYYQPKYYRRFRCDGSLCNAKCCRKWEIDIDGAAYKKYCLLPDKKERKAIVDKISFDAKKRRYAIKMKQGNCPFLGSDKLCRIQKKHGEEYLSDTCRTYPRCVYKLNSYSQRSLLLSCPVAAKLILTSEEPLTFEKITAEPMIFMPLANSMHLAIEDKLPSLQFASIDILEERRLPINERLALLGLFLSQLMDMAHAEELTNDKIAALAGVYAEENFLTGLPEILQPFSFQPGEYLKLMLGGMEIIYGRKGDFYGQDTLITDLVTQVFGFTEKQPTLEMSKLLAIYAGDFSRIQQKIRRDFAQMLENYLVNEWFIGLYPCRFSDDLVHNYLHFLYLYKLMEFQLTVMAVAEKKEPTADYLLHFFARFTATSDHSFNYAKAVWNDIGKRGERELYYFPRLLDM